MKDDFLTTLQAVDWEDMDLDDCKDKFKELAALWDFQAKRDEYCRAVDGCRTKKRVISFIWSICLSGLQKKNTYAR